MVTRNSPQFLVRLFQREVPELEKGILEIVNAVRDPGNRAKIAVRSSDVRVDPVGTCVGHSRLPGAECDQRIERGAD